MPVSRKKGRQRPKQPLKFSSFLFIYALFCTCATNLYNNSEISLSLEYCYINIQERVLSVFL